MNWSSVHPLTSAVYCILSDKNVSLTKNEHHLLCTPQWVAKMCLWQKITTFQFEGSAVGAKWDVENTWELENAWLYPCPTILLGLITAKFQFFFIFHFWGFLSDTVHKLDLNNIHLRSLSNYFGERTQLQDLLCFWDFQIFMEYLGLKKSNCVYLDNCDSFSDVHLPRESWHIHGLWYYGD